MGMIETSQFGYPGETWRPIKGFPGYRVSKFGRVACTSGIPSLGTDVDGYFRVQLNWPNGRYTHRRIHAIVAEAFLGECPAGHVAAHKNKFTTDNRALNLEFVPLQEAIRRGMERRGGAKRTLRKKVQGVLRTRVIVERVRVEPMKLLLSEVADIHRRLAEGQKARDVAFYYNVEPSVIRLLNKNPEWNRFPFYV